MATSFFQFDCRQRGRSGFGTGPGHKLARASGTVQPRAPARRPGRLRTAAAGICALLTIAGQAFAEPPPDNGAVVIMYHRVGDSRHPSTNVTVEQFEAHLAELKKQRYAVMALPDIVAALAEGRPLPARSVAITFDDAYRSVLENAWPRLKARGFPLTLFVATEPLDQGLSGFLSWEELRGLADDSLVTVGSQTATHPHLPFMTRAEVDRELAASQARFREELGRAPRLIAYPYGEFGEKTQAAARAAGFQAGFGQHSGAVGRLDDLFALPRFAFNEAYADMDRFVLAVNAKALPADEITPRDPVLAESDNPPNYGFTVHESAGAPDRLQCYAGGFGRLRVERLGQRVEVRFDGRLPPGRTRVNCTMPAGDGRWRWFGRQFLVPPRS